MHEHEKPLAVRDLTVAFGDYTIIDNISFTVEPGTTAAIIGPNGAGKSVLLKAILRLIPAKSGSVKIFGIDNKSYRKAAPLLSYIPQHLEFDRDFPLTIQGLFSLKSSRPIGMNDVEKTRMNELLTLVNMNGKEHQSINSLSGGQLQRILIAYSLMDRPKLLLLDEPSASIDVQGQETIYALLRRIQKEEGITMIIVSHELDVVMQYAQQVLCLNKQLLCAGIPRKVLTNEILEQMYGTPVGHYVHHHDSH